MYNKKNKKILSERIAEVLSSAPISGSVDPEDEDLLITPNILDGSNNGANVDSEDELLLSNFRKKNLDLLEDTDTRYAGKRSSRKSLNDCDNESLDAEDSKTESSDEEEGEEEEEDYEKGKEETSDIAVENITKFKHINESTSSQVTKGLCVQNQMNMWESLLEIRIQLQKCLLAANKMPQEDLYKELHRQAGSEFTNKINDTKKSVSNVLDKMLNFQKILLKKYPETKHLDKENKKEVKQNKESDEEIPSDTESEHEPESESEDDIEAPRKKIKLQDYESQISDLHGTYKTYRDSVIEKWNAKTRTLLAKNNVKSYTVLNQIEHILSDKAKLIKRTQLKKSSYHILGEDSKDQNDDNSRINSIEDFNSEIFDDDDFYHQLLRELIEVKSADITDPVQLGRQWIQLQNIRSKMKRKVDTKATKGRKIRYGVHSKLVNFMAPMEENGWTDEAKNELFGSLFGKSHTSFIEHLKRYISTLQMDKERRQSTISTDDDVLSISKIGLPWAEEKCETLVNTIQTGFLRWCQIALEIGVEKIEGSATKYVEEINNVCLRLLSDMETHKSEVLEDMEELLKKLEVLCKRLHVKMPKVGDQKTLIESWNELDSKVKQFEEHIKIREKEVHSLRSKQLELCKSLGKTPKILKDNPLPTTAEIEEFQAYLEKLEEEKFARAEQFLAIKEEIINMAAELEMVPLSDFEKLVISGSDNDFPLTTSNLKELRSLHTSLTQKLQNIKDEVADLRLKINDLWDKLEIDIMEREEFLSGHVGHSVEVLEALKGEFKRCEEIKKANIKVFIDKLRDELTKLWDQCHCSLPQRRDQFLDSDCFNEDLLQLHEIAVEKWKLYYNENKELINLLEKHNLLWKKMLELDRSATNADRYKNRGGKLLKEEKERNKLSKLIPKIEDEIITLATEFQQRHNGKTFTTFGRTVEEYISDLHSNRENDLKIKLSARKQQREQVLTPAKSKCNLFPSISTSNLATPVPLSATKRKVLATPNSVIVNKKAKLVPESATKSQKKIPSIKITRVSADRKRRISKRRQRRSSQSLSNDRLEQIPSANDTAGTEYHDFQNDLTSKNNDCRSTILPEQVTSTAKAPFRPKYTPTKPARTPISFRGTPKTPKSPRANGTQLSTCRSNIRLIF